MLASHRLPYEPGQLFACGAGGAAEHVGRSLTRRKPYTSDILQLKQEMVLQMNEGCTSDFPSSSSKLSCLRRASSPPSRSARFSRPGLPNQLIRAAKAAAKRRYFYQKSCLLPRFFAAFKSFSDFYLLSVEKRLQSHRLAQSLALARSFTVEKQLQSSNFLTIFTAL